MWAFLIIDVCDKMSDNSGIVEQQYGGLVPPAWEFVSEVWECERNQVSEGTYDHDSEFNIIR